MSFMQKQIYQGGFFEIDTTHGIEIVPSDIIGQTVSTDVSAFLDYLEGTPLNDDEVIEYQYGVLARMSAPGYLDCTCWSAHKTFEEANNFLNDMYDADED